MPFVTETRPSVTATPAARVEPMPNPVIPAIPYRPTDSAPRPPQAPSGGASDGTYRSGTLTQTIPGGQPIRPPLDLGPDRGRIEGNNTRPADGTMRSGTYRETIPGGQPRPDPWTQPPASRGSTGNVSQDSGAAQRADLERRAQELRRIDEVRAQRQRAAAAAAVGGAAAAADANKPANATTTRPRRDAPNADGSRTYDHFDASGKHVGTTVVGANNQVQQSFRRNTDGSTVAYNPLSGTTRTSNADGSGTTTYRNGTAVSDQIVNGERVTVARNPKGEPLYQYRAREERVGRETTYVYVPTSNSSNDLLWLWILTSQNRRAEEARRADRGFGDDGYYRGSGGGSGAAAGAAPRQPIAPVEFQNFVYNWRNDFPHIPSSMNTEIEYKDPLDWITDYIIFDLVEEYSTPPPAPTGWTAFWMWLGVIDRPKPVEVQYELSQEIRATLAEQIIPIVQKIRDRQPVRLRDFVNTETGEVQPLTIIVNEEFQVRNLDTAANCGIDPGDVLQLESFFLGSETTGVKVLHTDHAADSCEEGSTVGVKLVNLQNGLNELVRRTERGMAKAAQKRPGMSARR